MNMPVMGNGNLDEQLKTVYRTFEGIVRDINSIQSRVGNLALLLSEFEGRVARLEIILKG